jgi:hypothetical protein
LKEGSNNKAQDFANKKLSSAKNLKVSRSKSPLDKARRSKSPLERSKSPNALGRKIANKKETSPITFRKDKKKKNIQMKDRLDILEQM